MELNMQNDEKSVICRALDVYLSDLRSEISRTENYDMRSRLHKEKEVISNFIGKCKE
jgi:hypothetical protein